MDNGTFQFRYCTRYFTDSGIIGTKEFVSSNYQWKKWGRSCGACTKYKNGMDSNYTYFQTGFTGSSGLFLFFISEGGILRC